MLSSKLSYNYMITAPHHLATKTGSDILKEGGNVVEAMIASAAIISVVYPHMNSMGGDNFWLISDKNKNIHAIDSCGPASNNTNIDFYKKLGLKKKDFPNNNEYFNRGISLPIYPSLKANQLNKVIKVIKYIFK